MRNKTALQKAGFKTPRTWKELMAHPLVDEITYEGEDGIWVYLIEGWQMESRSEVHSVHEYTKRECLEAFRGIALCDCKDCVGLLHDKAIKDQEAKEVKEALAYIDFAGGVK